MKCSQNKQTAARCQLSDSADERAADEAMAGRADSGRSYDCCSAVDSE